MRHRSYHHIYHCGSYRMSESKIIMPEKKLIQPGWHKDIPDTEYHTSNGTSSTTLKNWLENAPNECLYKKINPKGQTPAMVLGSLVHAFVLEPDTAESAYVVKPDRKKQSNVDKAFWAEWEEENEGLLWVSEDDEEKAKMMSLSVVEHPEAKLLLKDSINESSIYWWYKKRDDNDDRDYKEMVKVRPDLIPQDYPMIGDLKTSEDATYQGFQRAVQKFYYHVSAAMYLDGVNRCEELKKELEWPLYKHFAFIVVSKTPAFDTVKKRTMYNTAVYSLDYDALEMGNVLYRTAMRRMFDGKKDDHPGIPEGIRDMSLQPWGKNVPSI